MNINIENFTAQNAIYEESNYKETDKLAPLKNRKFSLRKKKL